jgi:hypothetical protein
MAGSGMGPPTRGSQVAGARKGCAL